MLKKISIDKKKALLAKKEQILQEIQYYEKRIQDFPTGPTRFYHSSSDSEDDTSFTSFPLTLAVGPSLVDLKLQERMLRTCLQATQELTGLGVLESEVTVMVLDPVIEGEKPITEAGIWREVTAECRIDLVPFSITFYTHQPSRRFAPPSYRGMKVLPVKNSQEAELERSVLSAQTTPADAIELLRSYAAAYRSRRTTLARLANKYANNLYMEPLAEGGFMLKCGHLLSMSWVLDNRHSALAPFHHKMSFELEYMDESHLKIIKQYHRQLADPSLQTEERTQILSKIISTCLEAQHTQANESMESDQESAKKLEKTLLSEDLDEDKDINNDNDKRKRDNELMAPPETIPKKTKPKGKENLGVNRKTLKRSVDTEVGNTKRAKTDAGETRNKTVSDFVNDKDKNKGNNSNKDDLGSKDVVDTVKEINKGKHDSAKNQINDVNVKEINKGKQDLAENQIHEVNVKKSNKSKQDSAKNQINDVNVKEINKGKQDSAKNKKHEVHDKEINKGKQDLAENQIHEVNKDQKKNRDEVKNKQKNNEKVDKEIKQKNTEKVAVVEKKQKTAEKLENIENNPKVTSKSKVAKTVDNTKGENAQKKQKNGEKLNINKDKPSQLEKNDKDDKNKNSKAIDKAKTSDETKKKLESKSSKQNINGPVNIVNGPKNTENKQKNTNTAENNPKSVKNKENPPKNGESIKNIKSDKITKNNDKQTDNKQKPTNVMKNKHANEAKIPETNNKDTNNDLKQNQITGAIKTNKLTQNNAKNENKHIKKNPIKPNRITPDKPKNFGQKLNGKEVNKTGKVINKSNLNRSKTNVILNHRNPKIPKINSNLGINSKIPQKKLSPAYAEALKSLRASPRVTSKLKSSSDTNLQSKIFKPVTNIPRIMKKPESK